MKTSLSVRIYCRVLGVICILAFCHFASAAVYNLKIVTDASPDYSDIPSLIYSATASWETSEEKCWALFYWNHIARRQTAPMMLHGLALADPIRQFNDYGYTMCSTISGINCSLWDAMGFKTRYWDITQHTVPEVEYAGAWHMYDNSMSAIYTLCDGRTVAGVADIGKPGACAASGWKTEPGHVAKYHCLTATSANGFLTGADTLRSLDEESHCFNPNGLKERTYYRDWDRGHRYILDLRQNEIYTRYYHSLGKTAGYFVPNNGKDPEEANERYHLRGNGVRFFKPSLTAASLNGQAHQLLNVAALNPGGVAPVLADKPGEIIFKIEGGNVITSLKIRAQLFRRNPADLNQIAISTVNGLKWREIWRNDRTGETPLDLNLVKEINGAYEVLVKVTLLSHMAATDAQLKNIEFETITTLNSKTQSKLLLGKNTVFVGAGDQTESIVFWPDLRGGNYKPYVMEEWNIRTAVEHPGYMGVLCGAKPGEEAHIVFKVDAPRDITRIQYGGRLYNRAPHSQIDLLHSFDSGKTWIKSYSLTNTAQPWDVIHYETVDAVPPGARSVQFKYSLTGPAAGFDACSLYTARMEVNHLPAAPGFKPLEVTFNWSERQTDYSLVERSHTELVSSLPHRFTIDVGGADHPIMNWLRINSQGTVPESKYGYSDGHDAGGEKFVPRWLTVGKNLAESRPYIVSIPSRQEWGAGDPDGKKLTDGVAGPPYPGGAAPAFGLCWDEGNRPEITVDLGRPEMCAAFRIQLGAGWPWWDALKGEIKDQVELLTSVNGREYASRGFFDFNLRWKDLPVNHLWPDDEVIAAHLFTLAPPAPVNARYVRFKITAKRTLTVSEVQVLDSIKLTPFDLRVALPDSR